MKTVLELLKRAGGWHPGLYIKIDNAPYMELVIEALDGSGPCGLPAISVAHYSEQNGDPMRDPEICFELGIAGGAHLNCFYFRNDYAGVEQWSRFIQDGNYCYHAQLHAEHERFATLWDRNLRVQGFAAASRTNAFRASPLPRSGCTPRLAFASPPSPFNRSKGAKHHGHPSHPSHRVSQRFACAAE